MNLFQLLILTVTRFHFCRYPFELKSKTGFLLNYLRFWLAKLFYDLHFRKSESFGLQIFEDNFLKVGNEVSVLRNRTRQVKLVHLFSVFPHLFNLNIGEDVSNLLARR